jgi:hypothetical protein
MRKALLFIFFLPSLTSFAQITNLGFENWTADTSANNYPMPNNWLPGYICGSITGGDTTCAFQFEQTNDAHTGTYAIKNYVDNSGNTPMLYTPFDDAFNGPAFTAKPSEFDFWYKADSRNTTQLSVRILLYIADPDSTVGEGTATFADVSSYTKGIVPITYTSSATPNHIIIQFQFDDESNLASGDYFTIDDLSFPGHTPVTPKTISRFTTSNIVSENTLALNTTVDLVTVTNMTGEVITSSNNTKEVDFSGVARGLYLMFLQKENELETIKVLRK